LHLPKGDCNWPSIPVADAALHRQHCCPATVGGARRPSGRLGLAARPDQVVRAVLAFDQAGVDRRWERRIVDGAGHVSPPGLAGLLPARAHVMAGCLDAEVGSVLLVALVVEDELGLDVERLRNWPAKPSLSAVKVPMLAMMISFRLNKVRAHRVLVVIRPAGDGLAAPLAVETQWRAGRRKEFVPRGMRAAQGKLFSPDGCNHETRGAAAPPPGFTTTQGRLGPNRSERSRGRLCIPARQLHLPAH